MPSADTAITEEISMNEALTELRISQQERWSPKQKQGD